MRRCHTTAHRPASAPAPSRSHLMAEAGLNPVTLAPVGSWLQVPCCGCLPVAAAAVVWVAGPAAPLLHLASRSDSLQYHHTVDSLHTDIQRVIPAASVVLHLNEMGRTLTVHNGLLPADGKVLLGYCVGASSTNMGFGFTCPPTLPHRWWSLGAPADAPLVPLAAAGASNSAAAQVAAAHAAAAAVVVDCSQALCCSCPAVVWPASSTQRHPPAAA